MQFDLVVEDRELKTDDSAEKGQRRRIIIVPQSIARSLRDLRAGKIVSGQDMLREGRRRLIGWMLTCAGRGSGYSIAHAGVLLTVTERTVRNWIAETGLGKLYMKPRAHVVEQYRGIVRDPAGRVATLYTPWVDGYNEAIHKAKLLTYSHRIFGAIIEVEISENLEQL